MEMQGTQRTELKFNVQIIIIKKKHKKKQAKVIHGESYNVANNQNDEQAKGKLPDIVQRSHTHKKINTREGSFHSKQIKTGSTFIPK